MRVQDADGRNTYVDRDAAGAPRAIIAPDGRRTTLAVNGSGKLSSVTNPLDQARDVLLRRGRAPQPPGPPDGAALDLRLRGRRRQPDAGERGGRPDAQPEPHHARRGLAHRRRHDGRRAHHVATWSSDPIAGALTRTVTSPSGAVTELFVDRDGKRTMTLPSGEKRVMLTTADPRFGAAVPRPLESTDTTPSGKSATTSYEYLASLPAPGATTGPSSMTTTADAAQRHGPHRGLQRLRRDRSRRPRARRAGRSSACSTRGGGWSVSSSATRRRRQARAGDRRLRRLRVWPSCARATR